MGSVSVVELARASGVSDMTIRRDLHELEHMGLIRRIHGGAVSSRGRSYEPQLTIRSEKERSAKKLLGIYASGFVHEGDSISLDVGSTIYEVAKNLQNIRNITIVTPSIPIASLFIERSDIRLILPGGIVRPGEMSMIGDFARRNLEMIFVDKLFLGVGGIDAKAHLTEYNVDDTAVKQIMIRNSKEVILVVDSSKFDHIAFSSIAPFNVIHLLITNKRPPKPLFDALKECNVKIHVVSENKSEII